MRFWVHRGSPGERIGQGKGTHGVGKREAETDAYLVKGFTN